MSRSLRCWHCEEVIGVYEPMVVFSDGEAHKTSKAADPDIGEHGDECYHSSCYAQVYGQKRDL